ncbi:alpha-amylase family glycosyl hydrolase [Spirosoma flavum]|uniref:Alpha-amylase family glycosyl hydrolase n=1 Tax=Spirosoma flavum TaxID=2048557 RepID=A0ABW6AIF6_9BACT
MKSQLNINRRTLGITFPTEYQAHVVLWAPLAKQVVVVINDQTMNFPLTNDNSGYWHLETDQIKPGDTYAFVLDGQKECADPVSLAQPQGVYGPSQAVDTNTFYWEDSCWINHPLDEYIIYELDIHTFMPEGTLNAIVGKLGYLKKLGVNAIAIRPVSPFPDSKNQSYKESFSYAVQASYGSPYQLQHLINACHYEGIAVILDIVPNPIVQPATGNRDFGTYLPRKQVTNQDKPTQLNESQREAYQRYFIENALMWFRDFHADSLRLDAVHSLSEFGSVLQEIREHTNKLTALTGRQYYLLVEQDLAEIPLYSPTSQQVDHVQSATADDDCSSYYLTDKTGGHQTKTYREDYAYDSQFSSVLQELFERQAKAIPDAPLLMVSQNYKQTYNDLLPDEAEQVISLELLKLTAGSIMVSPYIPTIFMGEEWGATNPFSNSIQTSQFSRVQATNKVALLTDSKPLPWELLDQVPNKTLYHYYQALTILRREQPALHHLNPRQVEINHRKDQQTMILHRWCKDNHVLCLMNFSKEDQPITLPSLGKDWQKLLDSADPLWSGPGVSLDFLSDADTLILQPESIVVYKAQS